MGRPRITTILESAVAGAIIGVFPSARAQEPPPGPPPPPALVCSTLEVKTAERLGMALVIFHQANKSDGARLGELLKQSDGVSVEFETSDGRTHTATVFRLGMCFGRGLLVFPSGSAYLKPRGQFWLKFPSLK